MNSHMCCVCGFFRPRVYIIIHIEMFKKRAEMINFCTQIFLRIDKKKYCIDKVQIMGHHSGGCSLARSFILIKIKF